MKEPASSLKPKGSAPGTGRGPRNHSSPRAQHVRELGGRPVSELAANPSGLAGIPIVCSLLLPIQDGLGYDVGGHTPRAIEMSRYTVTSDRRRGGVHHRRLAPRSLTSGDPRLIHASGTGTPHRSHMR